MNQSLKIDLTVLCHKITGETRVVLLCAAVAGANQSAELWRGQRTGRYVVYHQDAYYDLNLQSRRDLQKMVHPKLPSEPLVHVGQIWGAPTWSPDEYWEIATVLLDLGMVTIDEYCLQRTT